MNAQVSRLLELQQLRVKSAADMYHCKDEKGWEERVSKM